MDAVNARKLAVTLGALLILATGAPASAASASASSEPAPKLQRLNTAIDEVLQEPEFAWRSPRIQADDTEQRGWLATQLDHFASWVQRQLLRVRDLLKEIVRWLVDFFKAKAPKPSADAGGTGWQATLQGLVWALIVAVAATIALLLYRLWRRPSPMLAATESVGPDLEDEDVTADELPEDEWLKLAADLFRQGDARLALRALYLACLAHLGARELLTISRAKSNREYQRELTRRARPLTELRTAFGANVLAFERAWYGVHEVTRATFDEAEENLRRIRQC